MYGCLSVVSPDIDRLFTTTIHGFMYVHGFQSAAHRNSSTSLPDPPKNNGTSSVSKSPNTTITDF